MKNILYIGLIGAVLFGACQNPSEEKEVETKVNSNTELEDRMLKKAVDREDLYTMLYCINTILEKDSSRTALYDTLFNIYVQMQNAYGIADVGPILLKKDPNDLEVMEPTAMAYEYLEEFKQAIEIEQRMYRLNGNPALKLQIAQNKYKMQDIQGAKDDIQWVLDNRQLTDTIRIDYPMLTANRMQKVKIRAIAYSLMGDMAYQLGEKARAIDFYDKSTKVDQNFEYANQMYIDLKRGR